MKRNKTTLKKALKKVPANGWQQRAAFILLHVNGIDNALEYVSGLKREYNQLAELKEAQ